MSVLTLVRHGQAAYMEADYDKLSPTGEKQARRLGEFWAQRGLSFDRVWTGPARRHRRTMEIAADAARAGGVPLPDAEVVPALDEFDAFSVMKQMLPSLIESDAEVRRLHEGFQAKENSPEAGRLLQKLFEEVARHWSSGQFVVDGIETYAQFQRRVAEGVGAIRGSSARSSQVLAFTSAGPIAATLADTLGLPPARAIEFVWMSRNSSYSQFLFSGERFTMHAFNAVPHLLDDLALLTYR